MTETQNLTLVQAIRDGLHTELREDDDVVVMGQDVGKNGGVFRATEGLYEEFGAARVVDTPLAESGIVGTSVGMAAYGLRPVPEIQFMGFMYDTVGQLFTRAARLNCYGEEFEEMRDRLGGIDDHGLLRGRNRDRLGRLRHRHPQPRTRGPVRADDGSGGDGPGAAGGNQLVSGQARHRLLKTDAGAGISRPLFMRKDHKTGGTDA